MKKLITLLAVGMMIVSSLAHAQATRVAEEISVAWRTATKAQELVVKMGLGSVPQAQLAARVQQFAKSGTPLAQAYARQDVVFKSLIGAASVGGKKPTQAQIDEAFNKAFTVDGQVLSATNLAKFSAQTTAAAAAVTQQVLAQGTNAQVACQASPASYLSGGDLAKYNQGLRTATALTGSNLLGGTTSCANWDKDMANGFAQLVIETDKTIQATNSRNYIYSLVQTYMKIMDVDQVKAVANLNTLRDDCSVFDKNVRFN